MKRAKLLKTIYVVVFVLMTGLYFVMYSEVSPLWSRISAFLLIPILVFALLLPRLWSRYYMKFNIVETRPQGDRILRIKGLNDKQRKSFLEQHMPFYCNDDEDGLEYYEWKPEIKIVDGAIYFLYPKAVGFSDFCDDLYPYIVSGDAELENEHVELTGWYPMTVGHSEKQEVPFKNKTLMLFRIDRLKNEDFLYFATEYNHVYKMELGIEKLTEVKDVKVDYEPMPDWNTLTSEI